MDEITEIENVSKIEVLNKLTKEYLKIKKHEYNSIKSKVTCINPKFKSRVEEHTTHDYHSLHVILLYNYTNYQIREDKFYHTLNDHLIDISHFTRSKDNLIEHLTKELKPILKKYKIKKDGIKLAVEINLDNFIVEDEYLEFIYSLNQFGIKKFGEVKIQIKYTDLNYE